MADPQLFRSPAEWAERCAAARDAGDRIVLVPTMGFLHEGHLSLMREARRRADADAAARGNGSRGLALATIFVNPSQFGPGEDLARYPRDLEGDLRKCAAAGIDAVLAPDDPSQVFGMGHQTWITVDEVAKGLDGASRPGHFRGVATVVAKLFHLSRPHVAFFGEKDFQQLAVIRALVGDLDFGIEVVGMPIVREADGLAMSSRNAYLSPGDRRRALSLSRALSGAAESARRGERDAAALLARARAVIEEAPARVDYVEIVEPRTLRPVERAEPGSVMLVAAFVGTTRLIDNARLP